MRGVGVLGIYLINVFVFGLPSGALSQPDIWGNAAATNTTIWAVCEIFLDGTMRGLFTLLFGASTLVLLREDRAVDQGLRLADRFFRRTIFLALFGAIHGFLLLNTFEVLFAYGILGMFLFPLRRVGGLHLLVGGVALLILASVQIAPPDEEAAPQKHTSIQTLNEVERANYEIVARHQMELENRVYKSDYWTIFYFQLEDVVSQESEILYRSDLFDIGGMMLIGMALFKLGVLGGRRTVGLYIALVLLGYGVGYTVRGYEMYLIVASNLDPNVIERLYDGIFYDLDRLAITLGHVGLISLLCKATWTSFLTKPLAALGRLALTNYIGQTVISIFLFYGFGFGLVGELERSELIGVALCVWFFQAAFSVIWLKFFFLGPLEWVWRSLIYGAAQPLRRNLPPPANFPPVSTPPMGTMALPD